MVAPRSVKPTEKSGFTLIEMSIVLVIIGLIIGGVLVGRDLVSAAQVRAQISQIEKYNAAVNTFRGKYGYLPGDMPDPPASQFGFTGRFWGNADGNGILTAGYPTFYNYGWGQGIGEVVLFWGDLTTAGLIDGGFPKATVGAVSINNVTISSTPSLYDYYPTAKIGGGNFIYVWSGGVHAETLGSDNKNYFGIERIGVVYNQFTINSSAPGISVMQAYNIDLKIDDGLPQSGRVLTMGIDGGNNLPTWLGGTTSYKYGGPEPNTAAPASSTTCYDNGNNSSVPMTYSMGQNTGAGVNCALSIQFQ